MTKEEAKDYIREWCPYDRQEEIIKALAQQPCEDCISRQEALSHKHIVYDDDGIGYSVVRVDEIMALSSVTPKAEIEKEEPAEWIVNTDETRRWDRVRFYCSSCNGWNTYGKSKYCPNVARNVELWLSGKKWNKADLERWEDEDE